MGEMDETVGGAIEAAQEGASKLNTLIALTVAVIATFMALCNVKGGNIAQAMAQDQANAVDTWAFFQAKSTKQNVAESVMDQLVVQRDLGAATMTAETKAALDKKISDYAEKVKRYEGEKNEIKAKAEGYLADYEALNIHDDQFDAGEALLSVAIALLGVTALTRKKWLFGVGAVFAVLGVGMGIAAFAGSNFRLSWLTSFLS